MIEGLIAFLQQIYPEIKIKQIVVDFMLDELGQVWLTDVQHIKTIKVIKLNQDEKILKHFIRLRNKLSKCYMCTEYKPDDSIVYHFLKRVINMAKLNLFKRQANIN